MKKSMVVVVTEAFYYSKPTVSGNYLDAGTYWTFGNGASYVGLLDAARPDREIYVNLSDLRENEDKGKVYVYEASRAEVSNIFS